MPTANALHFVGELSFEALSGQQCLTDNLSLQNGKIGHIEEAEGADAMVFAPATCSTISRLAHGMADSLPLQTYLSFRGPCLIIPAMESNMWEHAATQENIEKLQERGCIIVGPESGSLASGREGIGRMSEPADIVENLLLALAPKDFVGQRVLLTAGPTIEDIDPVRFIANRSSGKMGVALARALAQRGASVHLVHGPMSATVPKLPNIAAVSVRNSAQMLTAVLQQIDECDLAIMCAAVADFAPSMMEKAKIKKSGGVPELKFVPTVDIIKTIGGRANRPFLVGFAAETENLVQEAQRKCVDKNCDLVCANDARAMDAEVNEVVMVNKTGKMATLQCATKDVIAHAILDVVNQFRNRAHVISP
jgi:phosphopantothenoylcysteine decarboxylase/phosphopantothenate--cysteine ligase